MISHRHLVIGGVAAGVVGLLWLSHKGAASSTPAAKPAPTGQPVLAMGDQGSDVTMLQSALLGRGFDPGGVDGVFGANTVAAVRAFQTAVGIDVDGIVGPQTWAALSS